MSCLVAGEASYVYSCISLMPYRWKLSPGPIHEEDRQLRPDFTLIRDFALRVSAGIVSVDRMRSSGLLQAHALEAPSSSLHKTPVLGAYGGLDRPARWRPNTRLVSEDEAGDSTGRAGPALLFTVVLLRFLSQRPWITVGVLPQDSHYLS
jgi:hypothetical protein